jgi:hypothetical protein
VINAEQKGKIFVVALWSPPTVRLVVAAKKNLEEPRTKDQPLYLVWVKQ